MIVLLSVQTLSSSAWASNEAEALKVTLRALAETEQGRTVRKNLEQELYLDRVPESLKKLAPYFHLLFEQKIVVKWTF